MKLDDALDAAWEEWRTLTFEERVKRVDPHHERDLFLEFYHEMEARDLGTRAQEILGGDPGESETASVNDVGPLAVAELAVAAVIWVIVEAVAR